MSNITAKLQGTNTNTMPTPVVSISVEKVRLAHHKMTGLHRCKQGASNMPVILKKYHSVLVVFAVTKSVVLCDNVY